MMISYRVACDDKGLMNGETVRTLQETVHNSGIRHLRLGAPEPRLLQFRPGDQRLPLLAYFEVDIRRAQFHYQWSSRTDPGDRLLPTGALQASEAVGQMHRYLVHAVSCKWRTREIYFPTIPRTTNDSRDSSLPCWNSNRVRTEYMSLQLQLRQPFSKVVKFTEMPTYNFVSLAWHSTMPHPPLIS
jgi:hypothetical protein